MIMNILNVPARPPTNTHKCKREKEKEQHEFGGWGGDGEGKKVPSEMSTLNDVGPSVRWSLCLLFKEINF